MSSCYLLIFKKCPHATQTMSATAVCTISFGSVANRTKCTDIITSNEKQDGKKSRHDPARTVHGQAVLRSIFQFYKYGAVKD